MLTPVTSSMVKAIGYDPDKQEMMIEWPNGKVSAYAGVPQSTFEYVRQAPSIGRAVLEHIKGKYDHEYR